MPTSPSEFCLAVIEKAFELKKPDAFQRAIRQLNHWKRDLLGIQRIEPSADKRRIAIQAYVERLEGVMAENAGKYVPREDTGITPETAARPSMRDNVRALEMVERLTPEQAQACREIQKITEAMTAGLHARTQKYIRSSSGRGDHDHMKTEIAYWWSNRYVPWRNWVSVYKGHNANLLIDMFLLEGIALDKTRRILKMSYDRGYALLIECIDRYLEIRKNDENGIPTRERVSRPK